MTLLAIINVLSCVFHCFDKVYAGSNLREVFMLLLEYSTSWQVPGTRNVRQLITVYPESESNDS